MSFVIRHSYHRPYYFAVLSQRELFDWISAFSLCGMVFVSPRTDATWLRYISIQETAPEAAPLTATPPVTRSATDPTAADAASGRPLVGPAAILARRAASIAPQSQAAQAAVAATAAAAGVPGPSASNPAVVTPSHTGTTLEKAIAIAGAETLPVVPAAPPAGLLVRRNSLGNLPIGAPGGARRGSVSGVLGAQAPLLFHACAKAASHPGQSRLVLSIQGYLAKRGYYQTNAMKRRFFRVGQDPVAPTSGLLYLHYYASFDDAILKPKGSVLLTGSRLKVRSCSLRDDLFSNIRDVFVRWLCLMGGGRFCSPLDCESAC